MFSKAIETRNAPSGSDVLFVSFHACARGVSKIACSSSRARTSSSKFRFSQLFGQISRRTMRVFEALRFFVIRSCKKKKYDFWESGVSTLYCLPRPSSRRVESKVALFPRSLLYFYGSFETSARDCFHLSSLL